MVVAALVGCTANAKSVRPGAKRQPLELAGGAPSRSRTPLPLSVGALAVGTYTTSVFAQPLTLTFGDGWKLRFESPSYLNLRHADQEELDFLVEAEASVVDPPLYSDAEDQSHVQQRARPMPHDYIEYLRGIPYLDVGAPQPVSINGTAGFAFDYRVTGVPDMPGNCLGKSGGCFVPFASPADNPALVLPGATVHVVQLEVGTRPVMIVAASPSAAGQFTMTAVIATVKFG